MRKRMVVLLALITISMIAWFSPLVINHFTIESHIRGLHSSDPEIQKQSASNFARYGTEYLPRLISEYRKQPKLEGDRALDFNSLKSDKRDLYFDYGFMLVLHELGESAIPFILNELRANDYRLEGIAVYLLLDAFAANRMDAAGGRRSYDMVRNYSLEGSDNNSDQNVITSITMTDENYPRFTLKQHRVKSFKSTPEFSLYREPQVSELKPSIEPILKDIGDDSAINIQIFKDHSKLKMGNIQFKVASNEVLEAARWALKRMEE